MPKKYRFKCVCGDVFWVTADKTINDTGRIVWPCDSAVHRFAECPTCGEYAYEVPND